MLSNKPENYFLQKLLARIAWRCPGGHLPSTYLVFDTETGGTDLYSDRIIEFGFCFGGGDHTGTPSTSIAGDP